MNKVESLEKDKEDLLEIIDFLLKQIHDITVDGDDFDFATADKMLLPFRIYIYEDYFPDGSD